MEIEAYETVEVIKAVGLVRTVGDVGAEGAVVEGAEGTDDTINHGGAEDSIFLVDLALLLETIGRGHAAVG